MRTTMMLDGYDMRCAFVSVIRCRLDGGAVASPTSERGERVIDAGVVVWRRFIYHIASELVLIQAGHEMIYICMCIAV